MQSQTYTFHLLDLERGEDCEKGRGFYAQVVDYSFRKEADKFVVIYPTK